MWLNIIKNTVSNVAVLSRDVINATISGGNAFVSVVSAAYSGVIGMFNGGAGIVHSIQAGTTNGNSQQCLADARQDFTNAARNWEDFCGAAKDAGNSAWEVGHYLYRGAAPIGKSVYNTLPSLEDLQNGVTTVQNGISAAAKATVNVASGAYQHLPSLPSPIKVSI